MCVTVCVFVAERAGNAVSMLSHRVNKVLAESKTCFARIKTISVSFCKFNINISLIKCEWISNSFIVMLHECSAPY